MFVGYLVLYGAFDDMAKGARAAGLIAIVGFIFVPIIKFSVDLLDLRTLHQGASVSKLSSPAIHESMMWPLMVMAAAYLCYLITFLLLGVRTEIMAARVRAGQRMRAEKGIQRGNSE